MRMRYLAIVSALAIATPIVANQAMDTPGTKDVSRVVAGTYSVDPGHTLISWEVDHLGFTPYFGIFGDATGKLTIDPKNLSAAKVDITIPVSKVTTASEGLTKHLLAPAKDANSKPDFFGANPADARFVSTAVRVKDDDEAEVTGNLTLNGVTRPVTLDVEFYGAGKMPAQMGGQTGLGFEAEAEIKRSDFGIAYGLPMVSDKVKLKIAVGFFKD